MKKNQILITAVVAVIIGTGAFFAGMQYQKSQRGSFGGQFAEMRNGQGGSQARSGMQGARPVDGEILSQDATGITVKMQDGSTKIIILSDKTAINKASEGLKADLKTGTKVTVFGTQNAEGSMTAQNVSLGNTMRGQPAKTQ